MKQQEFIFAASLFSVSREEAGKIPIILLYII
jgi:hypothetical protein